MIEFKNVTKRYDEGKVAVDNLNLKIESDANDENVIIYELN